MRLASAIVKTANAAFLPRDHPPVLAVETKKERLNMISALTCQGHVRFMLYEESINQQRLIAFMRMIRTSEKKVFLILDNLKVHYGKKVSTWVGKTQGAIGALFPAALRP